MTDEEKEAIKIVNGLKEWGKIHFFIKDRSYARLTYNEVYLLLNLIEKQEKVIDEMAKFIESNGYYTYGYGKKRCDIVQNDCLNKTNYKTDCQNCMKKYFYRKVEK